MVCQTNENGIRYLCFTAGSCAMCGLTSKIRYSSTFLQVLKDTLEKRVPQFLPSKIALDQTVFIQMKETNNAAGKLVLYINIGSSKFYFNQASFDSLEACVDILIKREHLNSDDTLSAAEFQKIRSVFINTSGVI